LEPAPTNRYGDRLAHRVRPDQAPIGISNARDYLTRVTAWAQTQQVVLCIHNMFDDQFGVDTSSPLNYHFGLIDYPGASKGILF